MLVEQIYDNLRNNGIVRNKEHFYEMYLECDKNTYYYLQHKKREMSLGNMLKAYKNISLVRPQLTVSKRKQIDESLKLIQQKINESYNIKLQVSL